MNPTRTATPLGSVLIVDDSAVQRDHAVALCVELGVPLVQCAASGTEAIAWLAGQAKLPDLLIVDLEMPGMDGIELIQQLARREWTIPLIIASSREAILIQAVETTARNLGLPVLAGLRKPIRASHLRAAFEQARQPSALAASTADSAGPALPRVDALARAISLGEISVHYQPKVDIRTGIIRGVEALARWHRPGLEPVRPDQFIALAEREGLIHGLTLSVASQALAQSAQWAAHGLKISIAINLSPRLIEDPGLVHELSALAARHGVASDRIVLEITESSLVDSLGTAMGVLARLRLHGFGLSIDDYGTGFSSMQQLSRIPFTELEIDRSFVNGAHRRPHLRVILQSALDMARQLNLVTVAEGVETLEDWRLLQHCGCNLGQGFLIAKPMAACELPSWLKRHRARQQSLRSTESQLAQTRQALSLEL